MTKDDGQPSVLAAWFDKIDIKRRVKAVCKPCWEIQYCPYGSLVEYFPLADADDGSRCRIFGHQCPVFHVAEPFTETKELRNISRTISRPTQFRVLQRENQVCHKCRTPVAAADIHFDHIIPYSKGGSSDEHNVQLLCSDCNRKKSDKFEKEQLVDSFSDHVIEPVDDGILEFLLYLIEFAHAFRADERRFPNAEDIARCLNDGEKEAPEERGATVVADLDSFFSGKRPEELKAKLFTALRDRWGFADGTIYSLKSISDYYEIALIELLAAEISLVNRLGWRVSLNAKARKKWLAS